MATETASAKGTHTILYAISGVALILALVGMIVAFIAEFQHHAPTIATTNGFTGKTQGNEITLLTTAQGVLAGSLGKIISAPDVQITRTLLTGFVPNGTGLITAGDSLLSGLQKCVVLNQTPLTGFVAAPGSVTGFDTTMSAMQKIQGNIWPGFSAYQSNFTSSQTFTPLWFTGGVVPSTFPPTIPANFLSLGTSFVIRSMGTLSVGVASQTFSLRLVMLNNAITTNLDLASLSLTAVPFRWHYEVWLNCLTASSAQAFITLTYSIISGAGAGTVTQTSVVPVAVTMDFTQPTQLTLEGLVSDPSLTLTHTQSTASVPFHP